MTSAEIQRGMLWISDLLAKLASNTQIPINDVAWPEFRDDVDRKVHTVTFMLGDQKVVEKITNENLEAIASDKKIQWRFENRILNSLKISLLELADQLDFEVDDDSQREEERLRPHYSITSYGADYTVDGLVKRLQSDGIFIPPFQRKFVWRKHQASRFVESLLLGLPVPGIFLAKEVDTQRLLVIDGQQRLRTLRFFYEGHFAKQEEFDLVDVSPRFEGLTYRTLLEEDRRRLDDSILHTTVVKQDRPEDDDSSIYLVFERLNSGASLLHPQEIRACIFHGEFNKLLAELNQHPSWRSVYGPENARMKDQELILRFFALHFDADKYSKPMEAALNRYMKSNRELQRQSPTDLRDAFVPAIDLVKEALGADAFRPVRAINAAVFDAVMVGLAKRLSTGTPPATARFSEAYYELLKSTEFQQAYEKSTSNEEQVRSRLKIATDAFAGI